MAWSKVQEVTGGTTAAASTLALTVTAPTQNHLVVMCIQAIQDAGGLPTGVESISGVTQTNVTWVRGPHVQNSFNNFKCTELWYGVAGAAAGTTVTITATNADGTTSDIAANFTEWSGNIATNELDVTGTSTNTSTTPTSASITTTSPGELLVACEGNFVPPSGGVTTAGWTNLTEADSSGGSFTASLASAYKVAGNSSETDSVAWSQANAAWGAVIASFFAPISLSASPGSYGITGADDAAQDTVVASVGSYALAGQAAVMPSALVAAAGSYGLTGLPASLSVSGSGGFHQAVSPVHTWWWH